MPRHCKPKNTKKKLDGGEVKPGGSSTEGLADSLGTLSRNTDEIETKFIIASTYGVAGTWPHETVMVCRITDDKGDLIELVYRNNGKIHAEINFIKDLKKRYANTPNISIDVFMNYSPCYKCSKKIKRFVRKSKVKELNIMFSNLYKITPPYNDAKKNQRRLFKLSQVPEVVLSVFTNEDWEGFFTFVGASDDEKTRLHEKARKEDRRAREATDVKYLDNILKKRSLTHE